MPINMTVTVMIFAINWFLIVVMLVGDGEQDSHFALDQRAYALKISIPEIYKNSKLIRFLTKFQTMVISY